MLSRFARGCSSSLVKGIAIFDGEQGRRVLKQMGMMPAAKKTDKGMKVKPGKMIPEPQVRRVDRKRATPFPKCWHANADSARTHTCECIGAGSHSEPDTGIIRSREGRGESINA